MKVELLVTFALVTSACAAGCDSSPAAAPAALAASAAPSADAKGANTGEINPRLLRRFQPVVGQGGTATVSQN